MLKWAEIAVVRAEKIRLFFHNHKLLQIVQGEETEDVRLHRQLRRLARHHPGGHRLRRRHLHGHRRKRCRHLLILHPKPSVQVRSSPLA